MKAKMHGSKDKSARAIGGLCLWPLLAVGIVSTIAVSGSAQIAPPGIPNAEAKIAALREAGEDLDPLFVLGDVNEDGQVDRQDLELVRSMVQSGERRPDSAISCPAAADLNQDGRIDQRDLALLTEWVKHDKVAVPALLFQPSLPCDFNLFFIAARPIANPEGIANIRFLNPLLNSTNSVVTINKGEADAAPAPDGRGYVVNVRKTARVDDTILVKIALPKSRYYYYTLLIVADEAAK